MNSFFRYRPLSSIYRASNHAFFRYVQGETVNEHGKTIFHSCHEDEPDERLDYVFEIQQWLSDIPRQDNERITSFYHELTKIIHEMGYELNDVNQFKEDILHYMYILSDLDKVHSHESCL